MEDFVIIATNDPELEPWNGERGVIKDIYTNTIDGRAVAIVGLCRIACAVEFDCEDLRKA